MRLCAQTIRRFVVYGTSETCESVRYCFVSPLDEAVGIEHECGSICNLPPCRLRLELGKNTEWRSRWNVQNPRFTVWVDHHWWWMTSRAHPDFIEGRCQDATDHGCHGTGFKILELTVRGPQNIFWRHPQEGVRSQRTPESAHNDSWNEPVARDVAGHDPDVAAREFEGVVPVTPDIPALCRNIAACEFNLGVCQQPGWQKAPLQYRRGAAFCRSDTGLGRHCELVGDELEQHDGILVECSVAERAHVKHARKFSSGDEWDAQHRVDALFPKDRIGDRRGVDAIENHRTTLGGNTSSEANPDGDPHALPHLFLQSTGRSGDEVIGRRLQQKHGGGVAMEEFEGTVEEHG